jgi:DNA polymerase-3 subunit delta'
MNPVFSDVIGHELQLGYLSQVLERGSWAHAYVFSGPSFVGKTAIAERFASALLKTSVKGLALHPDFMRIGRPEEETEGGRKKDIPIDSVRELCGRLSLAALHGTKVAIIDDADGMNVFGQNALLKTLEEPSGNAIVILVTEDVDALLPTIRSRAVPLAFPRISTPILEKALIDRGVSPFIARESAVRALGRPGMGIMLTEEGKLEELKEEERKIRAFLSAPLYERMTLAGALAKGVSSAERERWLEDVASALQNELSVDPGSRARALSALLDTREHLSQNVNTTLALENIALSL